MTGEKFINQEASIKIIGIEHSKIVNIKDWTNAGLWVQSETLHTELALLAKENGIPGFLKRNPVVFLPFSRIEWVMLGAEIFRSVAESTQ